IARVALAHDAMKPEPLEAHVEHEPGRLGAVSLSLVVGMDDEPKLALQVLPARPPHAEVADQLVASLGHGREAERVAALVERGHLRDLAEPFADVVARTRLPVQ